MTDEAKKNRAFIVLDDGWRWEKRDILQSLKEGWDFDVATHDDLSRRMLKADGIEVISLPVYPLPRGFMYTLLMFFAKSLDTNIVRYRERIKHLSKSVLYRFFYRVRALLGVLHLRPYSYAAALRLLYRKSTRYTEFLSAYDMVVFNPVTIRNKRLLFEAKRQGLRVVCWVYSWDNPMKDNEFFTCADDYLVWNEQSRQHLILIHGLAPSAIHVVGPAQFDFYLKKSKEADARESGSGHYVLYACALGLDQHLEQEVDMILKIRELLDAIAPDMPLWVRPYPFRQDKQFGYDRLKSVEGIRLLAFGELEGNRIVITKDVLEEKYDQINRARCLINFGSTLGLEASFTETPIIQIGFNLPYAGARYLNAKHVFLNEHLQYIIDPRFPNIATNLTELRRGLQQVLSGEGAAAYIPYSLHLRQFAHPLDTSSYVTVLRDKLVDLEKEAR